MDKPLVSFIVTYHNEPAEMIEQCLDSILSDKEREIIMVDDGSDTNIFMALAAYHDKLTYIHQPNKGLSVARNTGLKMATGTYIQFVDADDYLLITAYEHTLDLARYHNPDIVLFRFTHKHESETPFVLPTPVTGAEYMRHSNLRASLHLQTLRSRRPAFHTRHTARRRGVHATACAALRARVQYRRQVLFLPQTREQHHQQQRHKAHLATP